MNGQLVEVAIGLAVAFFVVSLVASGVVEAISTITKKRANDLERTITKLLASKDLEAELKQTSAYKALVIASNRGYDKETRPPSYVPARTFADATIEMLAKHKANVVAGVEGAKSAAEIVQNTPLGDRLVAITAEVGENLTAVKAEVEAWFDSSMERLQGAYQRWARLCLFIVGLTIAVAMNVSATHVALRLWDDQVVRELVVASADRIIEEQAVDAEGDVAGLTTVDQIAEEIAEADDLKLPIGWSGIDWSFWTVVVLAIGWLITGMMTMLGAQFWFDAMKRLTALRGSAGGSRPAPAASDPASALTSLSTFELGGHEQMEARSVGDDRTPEELLDAVIPRGKGPAAAPRQAPVTEPADAGEVDGGEEIMGVVVVIDEQSPPDDPRADPGPNPQT